MVNLNLGAGDVTLPGWESVDIDTVNLGSFPWSYDDNSVTSIIASHILEHFTKDDGYRFVSECYRILKPGGTVYLSVPDMDIFVNCRLSGNWAAVNGYVWKDFNYFLGGNEAEPRPEMRHKYMYNEETLKVMFATAGFSKIERRDYDAEIDTKRYQPISLYMRGTK